MPIRFNASLGRYIGDDGRIISFQNVRDGLETVLEDAKRTMQAAARGLQDGSVTLAQWRDIMAQEVKTTQSVSYMAARGGAFAMSAEERAQIAAQTLDQLKFLNNYALQIQSGAQPLNNSLLTRSNMYAQAGRSTYEYGKSVTAEKMGYSEEKNVLGPADHCNGCLGETRRGFVRLGDLVPVGQRDCYANCRCHLVYRGVGRAESSIFGD